MRHLLVVLALAVLPSCASSPARGAEDEVLERNGLYDRALLDADSAALADLYAPEFTYVGPEAAVRTREQQIRALTSGAVDVLEGRSSDVRVRRYENTAVLTGQFRGRARTAASEFSFHERYSSVWVRRDGAWRLVLEHASIVKDPS